MAVKIDFFEDVRKQLEQFGLNFQVLIRFYPRVRSYGNIPE